MLRGTLTIIGLAAALPAFATGSNALIPSFVEETKESGITSTYTGDWQYMVGGGAASFDCSGDGFPDLYLAGGEGKASFYRNVSSQGGALRFEKQESGLEFDAVTGAYPLDVDADGITDLAVLRVGENYLMRGLGGCRFERANQAWGFDGGDAWSTALAATWEKGADWPTIAIGNYVNRKEEMFPWGSCTDNWLHRPKAGAKAFEAPLALKPSHCSLGMLFSDWNRSGTPSLRITNDREYYKGGQEQMWRMGAGEAPYLYKDTDGWRYIRIWGMGIAHYDLDFDGYPEYFMTSMADNRLQVLDLPQTGPLKPSFKEAAFPRGVTAHRPYMGDDLRPSTAWHTQFEDVNNDSRADLFIAKGNVAKMKDFAAKDPNNLLLQQEDGKFLEAGDKAGVGSPAMSRGGMLADYNLDGLIDILVVNRWEPAQIWRNTSTNAGHWLQVQLRQDGPNRDAINAIIEVKRGDKIMSREVVVGGGHVSGHLGWQHMGLGTMETAEIRVQWPDGEVGPWETLAVDRLHVLERGKPAKEWKSAAN